MKWLCSSAVTIALVFSVAGANASAADWWDEDGLVPRCDEWMRLAMSQPERAAWLLCELHAASIDSERRMKAALALLNSHKGFAASLFNVMDTGINPRVIDSCLAKGGSLVNDPFLSLLDSKKSPAAVKCRCIGILKDIQAPGLWSVFIEHLRKEEDVQVIEAVANAIVDLDPPEGETGEILVEFVRDPRLSRMARIMLIYTLGRLASMEGITFLSREGLRESDVEQRLAALDALRRTGIVLREREPRGAASEQLLLAADRLWEDGQADVRPAGATAGFIWCCLHPGRFDREMEERRFSTAFWLAAAADAAAMKTWCLAVSRRWPWPAGARLRIMREIIAAGYVERATENQRKALVRSMTTAFPEWPLVIAFETLALKDEAARRAGREVLLSVGDGGSEVGMEKLSWLMWDMDEVILSLALEQAGRFRGPLEWIAHEIIRNVRNQDRLLPYVTAASPALKQAIVEELLDGGDRLAWEFIVQIDSGKARRRALERLAQTGDCDAAMRWAEIDPGGFLRYLDRILHREVPEKAAAAAGLVGLFLIDSSPQKAIEHLNMLFPDSDSLGDSSAVAGMQACVAYMEDQGTPFTWSLRRSLEHAPSERTDAIVKALGEIGNSTPWTELADKYRHRAKKEDFSEKGSIGKR